MPQYVIFFNQQWVGDHPAGGLRAAGHWLTPLSRTSELPMRSSLPAG